jgi:triacylglycerol esterase/lipase EstA (alpha/beta hydrolase family)
MPSKNSTKRGANFSHYFIPAIILAGFFIFTNKAKADDINIFEDTTWHDGEIISIDNGWGNLTINPGIKLTIEAGAILKLENRSKINVYGDLEINGSAAKPVIITSIKDDSVGGDTNGDGNESVPAPGSWGKIKIFGSAAQINIDYAQMKYGGAQEIFPCFADSVFHIASTGNTITITHSQLIDNDQIFEIGDSDLKINYSNIYNNYNPNYCYQYDNGIDCGAQIENNGNAIYDLANNYWGSPFGPTQILTDDDWNKPILGTYIFGQADYVPFLVSPWTPAPPEPPKPKRNPVIIVPGIMGSYLKEKAFPLDKEIWVNWLGYANPIDPKDEGLKELEMDGVGKAIKNLYVDGAIENILTEDFYKGLIRELENDGYAENKDLFVFPYDWRYDINCLAGVSECADQGVDTLKNMIARVASSTGLEKVDIVAHSMGGLIAKTYIDKFGTSTIDKLVTIATPNLGSPRVAKVLLYGDNMDIPVLNEATMKEISQNIPSVYQLLPSQEYFNSIGSYIVDIYDVDNNGIKGNLNYADTDNFLVNTGRNGYLLSNATLLHNKIDNLQVKNSFSISGCGTPTIDKIYILNKEKNGGYEYALRYASGDGTVPLASSENFGTEKYYAHPADHGKISSANGVKQLVGAILDNKQDNFDFSQYQNVSTSSEDCTLSGTQISYHSPVSLSAYDQFGNHVGRNENGDTEINIPGAQYDEIDGNKFIFLPAGGNYTITGQATASGIFNARVETVESGRYTEESYFNEVPLTGTSTKVEMAIGDNQETPIIKVDQNGDGVFEEEKTPDSVLTEAEMADVVKPITAINLFGINGNNSYYLSVVKINLTATDDNSGILKTEYSLDNGKTWIKYNGEFTISQDGTSTILYSSTDKAGNREENKTTTIKIDQIKPTISILLPQENQEISRDEKLNVEYFAADNFSNIATATAKIYLDGQIVNSNIIDLFKQNLGTHKVKITIQDLAGNQAEQIINFLIITDIDGTIADVNRAYDEKMITKIDPKKDLIKDFTEIKTFQERYGQRIDKEKAMRDKAMTQCLKRKNKTWCDKKIGTIFDRFEYQMNKINQAVIKLKYNLILAKLDLYLRAKWINQVGYSIIKEDIKYLLSKI